MQSVISKTHNLYSTIRLNRLRGCLRFAGLNHPHNCHLRKNAI